MKSNEGCFCGFLNKVDIFSYIPVPHTYPISTTKSKVGSFIFLLIILAYFVYDFVMFVTANSPVINGYVKSIPINQKFNMPQIAFVYLYGPDLNQSLVDSGYFDFQWVSVQTSVIDNSLQTTKVHLETLPNCQPAWLKAYSSFYENLTCLKVPQQLMNPPLKRPESIFQRMTVSLCKESCKSEEQITEMAAGGRLYLFVNEPQGFNYLKGEIVDSEYPFQIYQFFMVPGIYNRIEIQFNPSHFTTYPNFLTKFTTSEFSYIKSSAPVSLLSNVTVFNDLLLLSISFILSEQINQIQVHYETLIQHMSLWGALASGIFTIMGICFLAYNRRKFLQQNPSWGKFDEALHKKKEVEMEERNKDQKQYNVSGISSIRKQVELDYDY